MEELLDFCMSFDFFFCRIIDLVLELLWGKGDNVFKVFNIVFYKCLIDNIDVDRRNVMIWMKGEWKEIWGNVDKSGKEFI